MNRTGHRATAQAPGIKFAGMGGVGLGLCVAAILSGGCSKKDSTPAAISIDDLKYPGALSIQDMGGGKVTLTWSAANNEADFVGFNIYGIKTTPVASSDKSQITHPDVSSGSITVTEGEPLQVLGDDNQPSADAIAVINKFAFDPSSKTPFETAATVTEDAPTTTKAGSAASGTTDKPIIKAQPISTLDSSGKAILPTCQVSGTTCTLTKAANAANPAAANGQISFDLSQVDNGVLTIGNTYCFFVLSTMKGGTKLSATTSNVACVTPKYATTFNFTVPSMLSGYQLFDLINWTKSCSGTKCSDPTTSSPAYLSQAAAPSGGVTSHTNKDPGPLYVETATSLVTVVAGTYSGVIDLGYYETGFSDPTLPAIAPTFTYDTNKAVNGGGYSLAGQSVPLLAKHMYVVAAADGAATTTPTTFYYDWIYVNGTVTPGSAVELQTRIPKAAN